MTDQHNQISKKVNVAFQGELGAYSQAALVDFFGDQAEAIPCNSFQMILEKVMQEDAQFAVLPVENSLAGSVIPAYDELIKFDLRIAQEIVLRVNHCLMTLPDTDLSTLQTVYSHPQALAQCAENCKKMALDPHPFQDTAGAAKYLSERQINHAAAIASELAAEIYGLKIIHKNFEDEAFNFTRFFVMTKSEEATFNSDQSYKTSIIFATRHKPHALVEVLNCLSKNGINLTKIESRPSRNRAWSYLFFVDFEGHEDESHVQKAFLEILKHTSLLKILGSYTTHKVG